LAFDFNGQERSTARPDCQKRRQEEERATRDGGLMALIPYQSPWN
jgi:hypothetical protein